MRVFYVHWNKDESLAAVRRLRAAGHAVRHHWSSGEEAWRLLRRAPPDALVISLARLPSHGRAVARVTTESKRLHGLPVIFVGGEPEKVAATRASFPSATYCREGGLEKVLSKVSRFVPPDPGSAPKRASSAARSGTARRRAARSGAGAAGYSGTPLPQKLGIKHDSRVVLVGAPPGFAGTLGRLPPGVALDPGRGSGPPSDVIVVFAAGRKGLVKDFARAARRLAPAGGLWVAWPKKASGVSTDLGEAAVREVGLAAGLVDNKVCAIDETWSGLRFVVRAKDRPRS